MVVLFVVVLYVLYFFDLYYIVFFFKQKTAYEMRISDWSSDVCSSDLTTPPFSVSKMRRASARLRRAVSCAVTRLVRCASVRGVCVDARRHRPHRLDLVELRNVIGPANISGLLVDEEREVEIGRASCRERVCQYV